MKKSGILLFAVCILIVLSLSACAIFNLFSQPDQSFESKGHFTFLDPDTLQQISFNQMTPPSTALVVFEFEDLFNPEKITIKGYEELRSQQLFSSGSSRSPVATAVFRNVDSYGTITFTSQVVRSDYLGGKAEFSESAYIIDTTEPNVTLNCISDYFTISDLVNPEKTASVWFEIEITDNQMPVFQNEFELQQAVDGFRFIINGRSYFPTVSSDDLYYLSDSGKKAFILLNENFLNPDYYFFPGNNEIKSYITGGDFFINGSHDFTIPHPDMRAPEITDLNPVQGTYQQSSSPGIDFEVTDRFRISLEAIDRIQSFLTGIYEPAGIEKVSLMFYKPDGTWEQLDVEANGSKELDRELEITMGGAATPWPEGVYSVYAKAIDMNGNESNLERYMTFYFGTTPFMELEVQSYDIDGAVEDSFYFGDTVVFKILDELTLNSLTWDVIQNTKSGTAPVPQMSGGHTAYWENLADYGRYTVFVTGETALGKKAYGEKTINIDVTQSDQFNVIMKIDDPSNPYESFSIVVEDELVGLGPDPSVDKVITSYSADKFASSTLDVSCPLDVAITQKSGEDAETLKVGDNFTKVEYQVIISPIFPPDSFVLAAHEEIRLILEVKNAIGNRREFILVLSP